MGRDVTRLAWNVAKYPDLIFQTFNFEGKKLPTPPLFHFEHIEYFKEHSLG